MKSSTLSSAINLATAFHTSPASLVYRVLMLSKLKEMKCCGCNF